MVKIKIGLDENVLDLISIGNVNRIVKHPIKVYQKKHLTGKHNILQSLGPSETVYLIEGLINQEVDNNIAKLLSLYHSQQPVIFETDSFTVAGKITDLEIPYDAGQLWRRYRLKLEEIPFWGTTIINEGEKAFLADLNLQYKTKQIFPTQANHNFVLDRENKKFSFEFILVNELEETDSFNCLWDDDQTSFWTVGDLGSGSIATTLSDDTGVVKKGSNSLKVKVGSGSYARWRIYHDYGSAQNWGGYDFLCFWLYGDGSGNTLEIVIHTTVDTDYYSRSITVDWLGWKRVVLPLKTGWTETGSPSLNSIVRIEIKSGVDNWAPTLYLDRGGVDVGNWADLELQIPDVLATSQVKVYSWDGSQYRKFLDWETETYDASKLVFLDGTKQNEILETGGSKAYNHGSRGETKDSLFGDSGSLTYSQTYGCLKRVGFSLKMPPWTGSDDLSGLFAINKVKLKIEVYYEKEKTTYIP